MSQVKRTILLIRDAVPARNQYQQLKLKRFLTYPIIKDLTIILLRLKQAFTKKTKTISVLGKLIMESNLHALKLNTTSTNRLPTSKEILMPEALLARFLEKEAAQCIKSGYLTLYPRALIKIQTLQEPLQEMLKVS